MTDQQRSGQQADELQSRAVEAAPSALSLLQVVQQRRSAQAFDGRTYIPAAHFFRCALMQPTDALPLSTQEPAYSDEMM
jgi:hypothetical protein